MWLEDEARDVKMMREEAEAVTLMKRCVEMMREDEALAEAVTRAEAQARAEARDVRTGTGKHDARMLQEPLLRAEAA